MELWLENNLTANGSGFIALIASFGLGFLGAVASCCSLPVASAITGFSGANSKNTDRMEIFKTGMGFLIGSCIALLLMGAAVGFLSKNLSVSIGFYWKIVSGFLIILLGLFTLELIPFQLPKLSLKYRDSVSSPGFLGLALGGASTACGACCNPMIGVVFGLVLLNESTIWGAGLMGSFALGYSLPMTAGVIGLQYGLGKLSTRISSWAQPIRQLSGVLLLLAGFYLIMEA